MQKHRFSLVLLILSFLIVPIGAQDDSCPSIVQDAIAMTDNACSDLERNTACYGHPMVEASAQGDSNDVQFSETGDRTLLESLQALSLGAMDEATQEWGVAVLSVQANLPDTIPGQNSVMVLFGNAAIEAAENPEADSPLQAFFFSSGIGDARCSAAPDSGLLIQTPEVDFAVEFIINEVHIALGSTVYIQAQPSAAMTVSVLEGQATLTAFGTSVVVPEGEFSRVPLNGAGVARDVPQAPQAIAPDDVQSLPVSLLAESVSLPQSSDQANDGTASESSAETSDAESLSCTASTGANTNLRRGPATWYEQVGTLPAGVPEDVSGFYAADDGYTWYQLQNQDRWVRGDLVSLYGESCGALPEITETPLATVANHPWFYTVHDCGLSLGRGAGVVRRQFVEGEMLQFMYAAPIYPFANSSAEARAAVGGAQPVIRLDGAVQPLEYVSMAAEPEHFNVTLSNVWVATVGTHTVTASWSASFFDSCTLEVLPAP